MTQKETVLQILNDAYKQDKAAIYCLFTNRVPCSVDLGEHSDLYVNSNNISGGCTVSSLGMLNGILETLGVGKIAISYDTDTHEFLGFIDAQNTTPASLSTHGTNH